MTSSQLPIEAQAITGVSSSSDSRPHQETLPPSHQLDLSRFDKQSLLTEILKSRRELMIARQQFEQVSDPLLIDHIVFRISAAERQLNFLFRLARENGVSFDGIQWQWRDETWQVD
ncbi:hypothetical protein AAC03nite_21600 [Alicyclobacillus acidoterrestris]|uniref:YaaL family protein n=1 Tax=Alicyclobacillus suci TaxID=2816080 RepID=UPI0011901250|nr:YaaL family protein [Alicyclobacillus suci]GEO26375.1 hypothetical protein AAC03nite_21600 [Alicyclobacillus acidoterrestris]